MTRDDKKPDGKTDKPLRKVPVAWEALEDAFENNAPEVHSYLHLENGEVIRIVDGIADPGMHQRVVSDTQYLRGSTQKLSDAVTRLSYEDWSKVVPDVQLHFSDVESAAHDLDARVGRVLIALHADE